MMKNLLLLCVSAIALFADIGTVAALRGSADVERNSNKQAAHSGMPILAHDLVHTYDKSRMQVKMVDQSVITIGPKSTFSFEEYTLDGANSVATMQVKRGFFRSVTGKIGKVAPDRFKIKTRAATIGIRGTDFGGFVSQESEQIACYRGEIVVTTVDGELIVKAGMMAIRENDSWRIEPINPESQQFSLFVNLNKAVVDEQERPVLFFDEADALLGKRKEQHVDESSDRRFTNIDFAVSSAFTSSPFVESITQNSMANVIAQGAVEGVGFSILVDNNFNDSPVPTLIP